MGLFWRKTGCKAAATGGGRRRKTGGKAAATGGGRRRKTGGKAAATGGGRRRQARGKAAARGVGLWRKAAGIAAGRSGIVRSRHRSCIAVIPYSGTAESNNEDDSPVPRLGGGEDRGLKDTPPNTSTVSYGTCSARASSRAKGKRCIESARHERTMPPVCTHMWRGQKDDC